MKKKSILIIAMFIMIASTTPVQSSIVEGINILSQDFHLWGSVSGSYYVGEGPDGLSIYEPFNDSYNVFSNVPITRTITGPMGGVLALSRGDVLEIEQRTYLVFPYLGGRATANVDASWVFKPLFTFLDIGITYSDSIGYSDTYTKIWLSDITEDAMLIDTGDPLHHPPYYEYSPLPCTLTDLNPTHEYNLRIYSQSVTDAGEGGWGSSVKLTATPEPATLLLLGLGAVVLRKRRPLFFLKSFC